MADPRSLSERLAKMPPGRHLVPRDFVVQNQRERMLLATAELVAERGYQKTTIELIAKTARVALSTFYEQFSSKEECFLAALDETSDAAAEAFGALIDVEQPWAEQVAEGLEIFLEMVSNEPARARLAIVESQAAGGAALKRYQAMLERVAPKLSEGREHNPRASRLPDGLEMAIVGGLAWLVHQRLVAGRDAEIRGLLPEMLQVTLTPYVGEVEAGRAADAAQARAAA
ncbi:MAG: TetR/AcrR family transcriptional regulator [Solirubrobacterales bacterium]